MISCMFTLAFLNTKQNWSQKHLLLYALPTFFIALAETGMAYIFPLIMVKSGVSNTLMGLILGLGAFIGMFTDILFPRILGLKGWKAQLLVAIAIAFLFPLFTLGALATTTILFFVVATLSWYIYYELLMISQRSFVVADDQTRVYTKDWGYIYFTYLFAGIAGPIIAQSLDVISTENALFTIIFFTFLSLLFAVFASGVIKNNPHGKESVDIKAKPSYLLEFKYFNIFSAKIFPVMVVSVVLLFLEEMFWNFGALLGDSLNIGTGLNWLVITLFTIPMLLGALILSRYPIKTGKKKLALIGTFCAGLFLSLSYLTDNLTLMLLIVFATGVALSFSLPLNDAVFSDYQKRSGHSALYLISLIRLTAGIAYLLEPITAGFLSDIFGYKTTFAIVGVGVAAISLVLFLFTPKKIHLPQTKLRELWSQS